jgi:pentatricopeptide repeat protein
MLSRNRGRLSTSLSPYAQALKHVALRGAAAFGPTAREIEHKMYRLGALPADYKPPVQGKWDDTVERWAYAWQFPALEEAVEGEDMPRRIAASPEFCRLVELGRRLAARPPSKAPGSASSPGSPYPLVAASFFSAPVLSDLPDQESLRALSDEIRALGAESHIHSSSVSVLGPLDGGMGDGGEVATSVPKMMPAAQYAAEANLIEAYLDDGSESSAASKELGLLLEEAFQITYEEDGLTMALHALAADGKTAECRAVFEFIRSVGFSVTALMFDALIKGAALTGDVNTAMAIVEEMKEKGVTPVRENWHSLMVGFIKAKDFPAVQQIVDNMKAFANIEPNEETFTLQLAALAKDKTRASSLAEAIQLFDQMENVYGYIAARPQYHALLHNLCQNPSAEKRLMCDQLGHKMELMGIVWDAQTYCYMIRAAQVTGDVAAVKKIFAKMRNERVQMNIQHLSWAIHAHMQAMVRADYVQMKQDAKQPLLQFWLEHMSVAFGIYELVLSRGWAVTTQFVNSLLRICCEALWLCTQHTPDDKDALVRFEGQTAKVMESFDEHRLEKDDFTYETYITLLARQQRIDEAEKLFQQVVLHHDRTPSRRTYEALLFMHLASGEEGGAARALRYLEAMERAKIPIRTSLVRRIVKAQEEAATRRDMKRRARRIMQAREEYMARKAEGFDMTPKPYEPPTHDADGNKVLAPLPIDGSSALAWWSRWKQESVSKHELFAGERPDGLPRGEDFAEKNAALRMMGIESKFVTKEDVPGSAADRNGLLPALRAEEGEPAGALWALDGGELSYPKDGVGPDGWGPRLWRERQLVKKEFDKVLAGKASPPDFSAAGIGARPAPDQLAIEESGAKGPGELADYRKFPEHVYDDGTIKPMSEFARPVPPSGELVWQQEKLNSLSAYKSDEEIVAENDNTVVAGLSRRNTDAANRAIEAITNKTEMSERIVTRGVTNKSKHDHLAKWRDMYRHGSLEAPDEPLVSFGRSPGDHKESMARTVRAWYAKERRTPASDDVVKFRRASEERAVESAAARTALRRTRVRRRLVRRARGLDESSD